jgi:hypothetical protein
MIIRVPPGVRPDSISEALAGDPFGDWGRLVVVIVVTNVVSSKSMSIGGGGEVSWGLGMESSTTDTL